MPHSSAAVFANDHGGQGDNSEVVPRHFPQALLGYPGACSVFPLIHAPMLAFSPSLSHFPPAAAPWDDTPMCHQPQILGLRCALRGCKLRHEAPPRTGRGGP